MAYYKQCILLFFILTLAGCQTLGEALEKQYSFTPLYVDASVFDFSTQEKNVKNQEYIFKVPVKSNDMIKIESPLSYQGLDQELGIFAPKVAYSAKVGQRFFKIRSDKDNYIYCELGGSLLYNKCLIDDENNGTFDRSIHNVRDKVFGPGRLIKETDLERSIPYTSANSFVGLYYVAKYGHDNKGPYIKVTVIDKNGQSVLDDAETTTDLYTQLRPKKEDIAPYSLSNGRFEIEVLEIMGDKSMKYRFIKPLSKKFSILLY